MQTMLNMPCGKHMCASSHDNRDMSCQNAAACFTEAADTEEMPDGPHKLYCKPLQSASISLDNYVRFCMAAFPVHDADSFTGLKFEIKENKENLGSSSNLGLERRKEAEKA